jgi:sec-independent protein translocase protein TatC
MRSEKKKPTDPDDVRMTIGEHLEELRGCVARSLVALVVAALLCIWPARYIYGILAAPLFLTQRIHGQPDTFLATHPAEVIVIYIKVVLIAGVVLAGPYIVYQLWSFVASGLYARERQWVYKLLPFSVALFVAGVTFMYMFVLLLSLNFLIGFSSWLPAPVSGHPFEEALLGSPHAAAPTSQPAGSAPTAIPTVIDDPNDPQPGEAWFNARENRFKLRTGDGTYSTQLMRDDQRSIVTTHVKIGEYLSFVLILTVAFGAAFQMPLVVLFLVRSGIVPLASMRKYRKVAIFAIVVIAGILAPPDLMSHLLLSAPMYLLFEVGLLLAARTPRPAQAT